MDTKQAFQTVNRLRKAKALLAKLRQYRFTREQIEQMEKKDWAIVAEAAGVHPPGETTISIVLEAVHTNSEIIVRYPNE